MLDPLGFLFGLQAAERVIPFAGSNESWPFLIRSVLEANGDCRRITGILALAPSTSSARRMGVRRTGQRASRATEI
jgi:hypothetical protein